MKIDKLKLLMQNIYTKFSLLQNKSDVRTSKRSIQMRQVRVSVASCAGLNG